MRLAYAKGLRSRGSQIAIGVAALLCSGLFGACRQAVPGDRLCKDPKPCDCPATADHGAVVVRWRISDGQAGQLLGRGDCCCMPFDAPLSEISGRQCQNFGIACATSPAWLIRQVQLRVTPAEGGETCIITKPCTDAELTTEYCLAPGLYDLQLTADIDELDRSCGDSSAEFVCSNRQAIAPPSVRRRIIGGQAVNLDGIVLGVNPPPVSMNSDGGTDLGQCSATDDGGAPK
jgi:hypothetical protein